MILVGKTTHVLLQSTKKIIYFYLEVGMSKTVNHRHPLEEWYERLSAEQLFIEKVLNKEKYERDMKEIEDHNGIGEVT